MTVDTSQNRQLGVWESSPFQITLYDTKNTITAEATHTEGKKTHPLILAIYSNMAFSLEKLGRKEEAQRYRKKGDR